MTETDAIPQPSPPDGYESWLEYAVATFDARLALVHLLFEEGHYEMRQKAEAAAWAELNLLREKAGQPQKNRPQRHVHRRGQERT